MEEGVSGEGKFGVAECPVCNRPFTKKHPRHKYCHWQCQSACAKSKEFARREQVAGRPDGWVAQSKCEALSEEQALPKRIPRGRYVYAWFNDESPLPFYIGKGVDDRAWRRHSDNDGRSHWCQQVKASSLGFRVEVIRENLTNEGAMLLESALITFVSGCGRVLANQVDSLKRREVPPLELAEQLFRVELKGATDGR
jgi:hypothetical protein